MKVAPEWQPLLEAGREMLAEAAAATEQGEPADDDDASPSAAAAAAAASSLSRVPRAAAPFVYLSGSSFSGGDGDDLLVPTIDLVVSFPALLPKAPGGGGGGPPGGPGGGNNHDAEFFDFAGLSQDRPPPTTNHLRSFVSRP